MGALLRRRGRVAGPLHRRGEAGDQGQSGRQGGGRGAAPSARGRSRLTPPATPTAWTLAGRRDVSVRYGVSGPVMYRSSVGPTQRPIWRGVAVDIGGTRKR